MRKNYVICQHLGRFGLAYLNEQDSSVKRAGVVSVLTARGFDIEGFDAVISSNVPLSAGMSSSAAFEISILFALKKLFSLDIAPADAARMGQSVENDFLGVKTGLLDQFSSVFGAENAFIL